MTFSPTPPPAPDGAGTPIRAAVAAVAEQSFFALVDDCADPARFDATAAWFVSVVRFYDSAASGSLACWVPPDLAQTLFDSFSGRDPQEPPPAPHQVDDLIGEFSNMVCGTWLSRCGNERLFRLGRPIVNRLPRPRPDEHHRRWVALHNRPLAIDWEVETGSADGSAGSAPSP